MCTPSRAALLTGLYQQRFGREFEGPLSGLTQYDRGLPLEATTVAETLQQGGLRDGHVWQVASRLSSTLHAHGVRALTTFEDWLAVTAIIIRTSIGQDDKTGGTTNRSRWNKVTVSI